MNCWFIYLLSSSFLKNEPTGASSRVSFRETAVELSRPQQRWRRSGPGHWRLPGASPGGSRGMNNVPRNSPAAGHPFITRVRSISCHQNMNPPTSRAHYHWGFVGNTLNSRKARNGKKVVCNLISFYWVVSSLLCRRISKWLATSFVTTTTRNNKRKSPPSPRLCLLFSMRTKKHKLKIIAG